MTRDEILSMKPGRELDALIMRTVFKAEKKDIGDECYWVSEFDGEEVCWPRWFRPSLDISAAWEVVEEMLERGGCEIGCYGSKSGGKWFEVNVITMNGEVKVTAHTAPEAICKAALLAVMDGEDDTN